MVNPRNKGKSAELEVITLFRDVMRSVESWFPESIHRYSAKLQRNSLQSAHGGDDIHGLPGLSVEVKRHETLHIEAWWRQCAQQAQRVEAMPVLIWRQSRQPWQCRTWVSLHHAFDAHHPVIATLQLTDFLEFYRLYYHGFLTDIHRQQKS